MAELTTEERLAQQRANAHKKIAAGQRKLRLMNAADRKRDRDARDKRRAVHALLMEEAGLAEVDVETLKVELGALGKRLSKEQGSLAVSVEAAEGQITTLTPFSARKGEQPT